MIIKASIGLFISPGGEIFPVRESHISAVLADPERFGLTPEEIRAVYAHHGEPVGVEGEARREILLQLISQGWIRIRRYPNRYWSVIAPSFTAAVKDRLQGWAAKILRGTDGFREPDRYMPVRISTFEGENVCTIQELADGSCPQ